LIPGRIGSAERLLACAGAGRAEGAWVHAGTGGSGDSKGAPNRAGAEQLIDYLTQPKQQTTTAAQLAFFPVTTRRFPLT